MTPVDAFDFAFKIAQSFTMDIKLIQHAKKPNDSLLANDTSLNIKKTQRKINIEFVNVDKGLNMLRREYEN